MAGEICSQCGKQHGIFPSIINKWHRCTNCGSIYCDDCGKNLPGKRGISDQTRSCTHCGNRTYLW